MRDDRYKGTSLPSPVRKLCRMAEREADRTQPQRMLQQAVAALVSVAEREISPEFRRRLKDRNVAPSLFDGNDLAAAARTGLEAEIARVIDHRVDSTNAISEVLRRRGEGYVREQKCQLVADRHPNATIASESVRRALDEGAVVAASLVIADRPVANMTDRVQLSENLLVLPGSGVSP